MSQRSTAGQHRVGTAVMVGGTAFSIVAVYVFQVVSSRTLGPDAFAPVGVLWTVAFLAFTVAMIPAEQFITRRIVRDGGRSEGVHSDRWTLLVVFGSAILIGVGFVAATLDVVFDGDPRWIALVLILLVNRSILATARGYLAGHWRFVAYGGALAAEGVALLVLGLAAAHFTHNALGFGAAMTVAPLAVLVVRPFHHWGSRPIELDEEPLQIAGAGFLGFYVIAATASQLIIAGGPIVVGFIGGTSAAVSVYFITFTLFRGPITSSYNLIARVLPDFTLLAANREEGQLAAWSKRFAAGGVGLGVVGFVVAGLLGPWIVTVLYGAEFAPGHVAAALGGGAVGVGLAALFSGQVLVARGRTETLAGSWIVGLVAAGLALVLVQSDPVTRVAAGFVAGEVAALTALTISGITVARSGR